MRTTTVAAVSRILPALTVLSAKNDKTRQAGKKLRFYREDSGLDWTPKMTEAARLLLEDGYVVKVFEDDRIHTLRIDEKNPTMIAWDTRKAGKTRDYTVVEVGLGEER